MTINITRDDIANYLFKEFGLSKNDCNEIVNEIIEQIILALKNEDIVKIHNFGTFKIRQKKSRIGRNPKTKVNFTISSRKVISFLPSQKIMNKINKGYNE